MAHGARLGTVVMFVRDTDRSVTFYEELLRLKVADHSPTAALLSNAEGTTLVLRAMGRAADRALGSVGVQYVAWTAADSEDLERCERLLKGRGAHRETRKHDTVTVVEGRDPDDIVVVVAYPGPDEVPLHEIPARIYGW